MGGAFARVATPSATERWNFQSAAPFHLDAKLGPYMSACIF